MKKGEKNEIWIFPLREKCIYRIALRVTPFVLSDSHFQKQGKEKEIGFAFSVTRFTEISLLWQKCTSIFLNFYWHIFIVVISQVLHQTSGHTLANEIKEYVYKWSLKDQYFGSVVCVGKCNSLQIHKEKIIPRQKDLLKI